MGEQLGFELVHLRGHFGVVRRQSIAIVRRQGHLHPIVNVEPLGMMPHLLRQHRHLPHELPRLVEVYEGESFGDGVPLLEQPPSHFVFVPSGGDAQLVHGGGSLFGRQLRRPSHLLENAPACARMEIGFVGPAESVILPMPPPASVRRRRLRRISRGRRRRRRKRRSGSSASSGGRPHRDGARGDGGVVKHHLDSCLDLE
mmetsp:Transcript_45499/g.96749  ORF Transcript_45499/g.96749 Transcript_45499/m.96749 type:complete len:200 (-) Transcript_45499:97-696(-)